MKAALYHQTADVCELLRHADEVDADARTLADLASRYRLNLYRGLASAFLAWIAMQNKQFDAAVTGFELGLAEIAATGARISRLKFLSHLAMAMSGCGRLESARRTIEQAIAEAAATGEAWCDAELWRVRGEILLNGERRDIAEAGLSFTRALDLARAQGAKLWELRTATSLARLWAEQGEFAKAVELLAPLLAWFGSAHGAPDVDDARALFARLRPGPQPWTSS
jgi:predicted ATPase